MKEEYNINLYKTIIYKFTMTNQNFTELISRAIHFYNKYKVIINIFGFVMLMITVLQGIIKMFIVDTIIFIFLGYKTIYTIKNASDDNNKLVHILKLWGFYTSLSLVEKFTNTIIAFTPFSFFYNCAKFLFYSWLMKNKQNIDLYYDSLVVPIYTKYEKNIISVMSMIENITKLTLCIIFDYMNSERDALLKSIVEQMNGETVNTIKKRLAELQLEDNTHIENDKIKK